MKPTPADLLRAPRTPLVAANDLNAGLPSRSEIEAWSASVDQLSAAAEAFGAAANQVETATDAHVQQLLAPGNTDWEGAAADAAQRQGFSDRGIVYAAAELMQRIRRVANAGAGTIRTARDHALDAISEAENDDFRVLDDLTVADTRRYGAQQASLYASRKAMAEAHRAYIAMRAQGLLTEDIRVGTELSSGAAQLEQLIPSEWAAETQNGARGHDVDGGIQALDNDSDAEGPLSGEEIAERLRELRRGLNRGVAEVDTEEEIFDLYEELARGGAPLPTPDNYYDRRVLPDGTIIGVRESGNHGPTLDVRYPPGVSGPDKIHLPPPPVTPPPPPPTPGEAPIIAAPPNLPVVDHPPAPGLIPPWAQTPAGVPGGPFTSGGLPPGVGIAAPEAPPLAPSSGSTPGLVPHVTLPSPTPEQQVGIGSVLFGGLLAFLGWLGTPKVSY